MSRSQEVAKQMAKDCLELEKLTEKSNQRIPSTELGLKYNIDPSLAGELWRGVRMGMLGKSDDKQYGKAVKQMYDDNIVENINNMSYKEVDELYHVKGNAGMHLLQGLEAAKLNLEGNIVRTDSDIPDNITAEHIKKAVEDYIDGKIQHSFNESRTYDVIIDGNRYPPKAIIGLASRYVLGEVLTPVHFRGGLHTKCFRILKENGFKIVLKSDDIVYPDVINEKEKYYEGAVARVTVNRYERDDDARAKCIEHHGLECSVCGFDFEKVYGDIGVGFIHVHHLKPISNIGQEYHIDPIKDLRPVCPNCHAMLHKKKPEPYSVEELKVIIEKVKKN